MKYRRDYTRSFRRFALTEDGESTQFPDGETLHININSATACKNSSRKSLDSAVLLAEAKRPM